MSIVFGIVKKYFTGVAVALPASAAQSANRIGAALQAHANVKKEIALGVLNVMSCGLLEITRVMLNPMVSQKRLEAMMSAQTEAITTEMHSMLGEIKTIVAPTAVDLARDGSSLATELPH